MKNRVTTAILLLGILALLLFSNSFIFNVIITIIMLLMGYELLQIATKKITFTYIIALLLPVIMNFAVDINMVLLYAIPVIIVLLYVLDHNLVLNELLMVIFSTIYIFIVALSLKTIQSHSYLYTIMICLATFGCDTGAFIVGKFFGKHKLAPKLSPKKTIEGAIGGWFIGCLITLLFSIFAFNELSLLIILSGLLLPIFSQFGDLFFSKIKRELAIKDFSDLLPGHGGVVDRLDSITLTIIVFMLLLQIV